ncbi:MAG: hypothetical protein D6706_21170 [Chloroflexi bacterium]|nr:MAG: hypothetical protein D6706_21170 [Chloroflexota bacterium]
MCATFTNITQNAGSRPNPVTETIIEQAILHTVAYVDVFDYPLTAAEIHRYLIGVPAKREEVEMVLGNGRLRPHRLHYQDGYYMLPGRAEIVARRQERAAIAARLWPEAIRYGRYIASFPFVRMVAVTGSLAVNNPDENADIDYLIITENGRLWLCRAFVIALVRLAARRNITLCPNYFLAESALAFPDQTLYTAHEVTQMIPLSGHEVYQRLRQINAWTNTFLPNAQGTPRPELCQSPRFNRLRKLIELPLRTPPGQWLDRWEMNRKIRKFHLQETDRSETDFCPAWCKGHFDGHQKRTIQAYETRVKTVLDT